MTQEEKLKALNAMLDEPESEDVLSTYLSFAGRKILNRLYPFRDDVDEVPAKYHELQCEAALYMLNKRGAEGETAHNENGINRTYGAADLPASMLKQITPMCGVI